MSVSTGSIDGGLIGGDILASGVFQEDIVDVIDRGELSQSLSALDGQWDNFAANDLERALNYEPQVVSVTIIGGQGIGDDLTDLGVLIESHFASVADNGTQLYVMGGPTTGALAEQAALIGPWGFRKFVTFPNPAVTKVDDAAGVLQDGQLIYRELNTSKGPLEMLAETSIEGNTLHLKDIAIFAKGADKLELGASEVAALRGQLADEARRLGFEKLRITGTRLTGANREKLVDITIDLKQ